MDINSDLDIARMLDISLSVPGKVPTSGEILIGIEIKLNNEYAGLAPDIRNVVGQRPVWYGIFDVVMTNSGQRESLIRNHFFYSQHPEIFDGKGFRYETKTNAPVKPTNSYVIEARIMTDPDELLNPFNERKAVSVVDKTA